MADALHNLVASALASNAVNVVGGSASQSTMRGSSAGPVTNLGPAPQTIIGPPKGRQTPGEWEVLYLTYPMRVYTGKLRNATQTQHDINEWVDAFLAYYRNGISLGGIVTAAWIESWDTDRFYEVGGEPYQAIDFSVAVEVDRPATYTA